MVDGLKCEYRASVLRVNNKSRKKKEIRQAGIKKNYPSKRSSCRRRADELQLLKIILYIAKALID